MVKKTIGKNTLGDNNKMKVAMRDYERSTHNLSYIWRNTQAPGTLVPCMKILATPGTTYKIKANSHILTHPTVGPLFGSYKFQMDIFTSYRDWETDRKSTRLNSSHRSLSRMPSSA